MTTRTVVWRQATVTPAARSAGYPGDVLIQQFGFSKPALPARRFSDRKDIAEIASQTGHDLV
jgi:hypothetical protein